MSEDLINLAIVLTSFEPGGTERQMTELIRRLDPDRFRVHVACFHKSGAWLSRVEPAAVEIAEFRLRSFKSPTSLPVMLAFARWLRARRIEIAQTCDLYANVFALPAAALARVPLRIGSRRDLAPPGKTRAHLIAQRLAYRLAHRVVANSTAAAECVAAEGVPRSRVCLIPNGIDLSRFASRPARSGAPIVAIVANLRPEKARDVLLRAAALVRPHVPDVRFRIIGDGVLRDRLPALARDLGVADIVDFLGHREDVPALLAESSAFAFPSRTEAFPNGLIEGMAAGLPVVSSAVGGMLELVEHDRNGLLVPPDDAEALASALRRVLVDAALAQRLGEAARATIQSRYSFERMVGAFEDLYLSAGPADARNRVAQVA